MLAKLEFFNKKKREKEEIPDKKGEDELNNGQRISKNKQKEEEGEKENKRSHSRMDLGILKDPYLPSRRLDGFKKKCEATD